MPSTTLTKDDLGTCTLSHTLLAVLIWKCSIPRRTFSIVSLSHCSHLCLLSQLVLLLWLCGWTGLGSPCKELTGKGSTSACMLHWDPSSCDSRKTPTRKNRGLGGGPSTNGVLHHMCSHFLYQQIGIWVKIFVWSAENKVKEKCLLDFELVMCIVLPRFSSMWFSFSRLSFLTSCAHGSSQKWNGQGKDTAFNNVILQFLWIHAYGIHTCISLAMVLIFWKECTVWVASAV